MSLFDSIGQGGTAGPDKRRQLVDYIKLQVYEDGYIDRQEERKILEQAITLGVGMDEGMAVMREMAADKGWVLEREAEERCKDMLANFAVSGGVVDKKEFTDTVAYLRTATKNKLIEAEAKRRVKKLMMDNGWKAKEGGLFGSDWFSDIK